MYKLTFLFILSAAITSFGQSVDYNKIILPEGVSSDDFSEKLVQLAWKNYPSNEILQHNIAMAKLDKKKAASQWLDIFSAAGNLNEFTIKGSSGSSNNIGSGFFPRYNFGARLTLGMFFSIPYDVKRNNEQILVNQLQLNQQKLDIRAAVLKAYNDYQYREQIFKLYSEAILDAENAHRLVEQKFKQGEVSFDAFNSSLNIYNRALVTKLEAETQYKNAKVALENFIGVKLEDVR